MVFLRVLSVHHTSSLYIATMLAAAFLCRAFALAGILHSQSRFGLWNLILNRLGKRSLEIQNHVREDCRLGPKCITQVSRVIPFIPPALCFYFFFFLASQEFDSGIPHWVNSSSQIPTCSVEPGTPSLPRAMLV